MCNAASDGTITVSAPTGGYGTYEYRLGNGVWLFSGSFTGLFLLLIAYKSEIFYIACVIVLGNQTITQPDILSASVDKTSCNGANNGIISITNPTVDMELMNSVLMLEHGRKAVASQILPCNL
jgi:hypothetical protein